MSGTLASGLIPAPAPVTVQKKESPKKRVMIETPILVFDIYAMACVIYDICSGSSGI